MYKRQGVNQDGPPFTGEAFYNPGPGTLGTLQRRMFNGPWTFNIDMSMKKKIQITERISLDIRCLLYTSTAFPATRYCPRVKKRRRYVERN